MAYLINYTKKCQFSGCYAIATKTLFNWQNARIGDFCNTHSFIELDRQNKSEENQIKYNNHSSFKEV